MNFFRTTFFTSLSTLTSLVCGLVTTKFIAVNIGAAGIAYTGQLVNISAIITLLGSAACTNGVVKYLAEKPDKEFRKRVIQTIFKVCAFLSVVIGIVLAIFSVQLSQKAFLDNTQFIVFITLGLVLFFSIQNVLFYSILNGIGEIKTLSYLGIVTAIINTFFVIFLGTVWGLTGVLISASFTSITTWGIGYFIIKRKHFYPNFLQSPLDRNVLKLLSTFTIMNLVSGILVPAVQIFIRSKLIYNININEAGLWQAATRISDYYINFLYSVLSVYFLPKLSSIHEIKLLRREIILGYARILPMVLIITGIVWILRDLIISVVLTEEFRGMLPILKLYLIGDVIKICSWILAFLLWAKAMMRAYIISELSFTILSVILNVYFINEYGAIGTGWAYIISYSYYFVLIFLLIRGKLKIKNGYS